MKLITIACDKCGWQDSDEEYFFEYEGQLLCAPDYHNTEEGKARLCRIGK